MAADPIVGVVLDLINALDRDLAGYRTAGIEEPNRLLAGRAALHDAEYAIQRLMELRATLLRELGGTYSQWDRPDVPDGRA